MKCMLAGCLITRMPQVLWNVVRLSQQICECALPLIVCASGGGVNLIRISIRDPKISQSAPCQYALYTGNPEMSQPDNQSPCQHALYTADCSSYNKILTII